MTKWQEVKLGDICEYICGGGTPKSTVLEYYGGQIPWLNTKEVHFNRIYTTEKYITEKGLANSSAKWLPINSVIVAMYGATAGNIAINKIPLTTNQACCNLIINEKKSDYRFVYFYLLYKNIELSQQANGGAQQNLNAQQIKDFPISLPPLDTQKKIAAVLGALDDKIELNNKINNNLEQQAQALFKSWFIDFEPFGGIMPTDWKVGKIDDLAQKIICGKTPSTRETSYYGKDVPFITIPDMHNNTYIVNTERYLSISGADSQKGKMLPKNSVCVSCIGTAGLVSLTAENSQTNQQINSIIAKKNISPYFIYLLMKSLFEKIQTLGAGGSTICNLNKTQFSNIEVILPNVDILEDFDKITCNIFEEILHNQQENTRLAQLRDTLLPKLMSGEIDVSNVDISNKNLPFCKE